MKISIKVEGLEALNAQLKDFSDRRARAAVATALTRTAVQVREHLHSRMRSDLKSPKPYTLNQLRYVPASAQKLAAAIGFNIVGIQDIQGRVLQYRDLGPGQTPAGKYMAQLSTGGQRNRKRFESALEKVGVLPSGWYAVPGARAKMDAYGNQSVGELRQILSWFDAAEMVAGSRQNMGPMGRDRRRQGTKKTAGFEYFVVAAGGMRSFARSGGKTGSHKMQPGIYRRTSYALGSRIEPVVIFVRKAVYRRMFDFNAIGEAEAMKVLPREMQRAIEESAARLASSKGGA